MARLFPEDFDVADNKRRFSGELATLLKLKEELSDQYCVFHGGAERVDAKKRRCALQRRA